MIKNVNFQEQVLKDFGFKIELIDPTKPISQDSQINEAPLTGGRESPLDKVIYPELKRLTRCGTIFQKENEKIKTTFLDVNGNLKGMEYENIYFSIYNSSFQYPIEIDQDFHQHALPEKYFPIHEILRESRYFDHGYCTNILLRFGYKVIPDRKKLEVRVLCMILKFLYLLTFDDYTLHDELMDISIEKDCPLVIFVNYPLDNEHIKLHLKMDSQPIYKTIAFLPSQIKILEMPRDPSSNENDSENFELMIFRYKREDALKAAQEEQHEILSNFRKQVNESFSHLKDNLFKQLIPFSKKKDIEKILDSCYEEIEKM